MTRERNPADYAYLTFTGLLMGAADVVPGVSGGTMAFIMGVYQELIDAIKSFNVELAKKALRFDIKGIFEQVPWRFLLALGSGVIVSFLSLAHLVSWLLENHQPRLYALFFGLVLASIVTVARGVKWSAATVAGLIAGSIVAYWIVGLVPVETSKAPVVIFLAATVAISAMILPGISGSFILLILGQYAYILGALKDLNIIVLLPFMAGCVVGLMAFSRVLSWLFINFEQMTITLLVGFMIGSLRKIWPFKETVETMVDRHGEVVPKVQHNLMPDPSSPETWWALGLAIVGFALILGLDQIRQRLDARHAESEASA